ncbi:hypothetical protein [Clostridium chromiireducens]|uniref:Uncharacterized protein n=1 Tax=Clostridium chromiireducens TaxID=225345 RepID=A0A1V4I816_9CLOT|nr:hypothetical protein [Clostridium chromiireducens]MVX65651.1 hypothetical protein [Clostridium chromiireducens]OPJ56106.1 hypothetical protein CLCHR_46060 [Clostridium chromiireducens]RII33751.1 hypothetical protein D2A34_18725 [Clostridium chromiireducens]
MNSNNNYLSECECALDKWIHERCNNMDLLVVNDVPILAEDCLSLLKGSIAEVNDCTDKLIVTTTDNISYVLESFDELSVLN